MEFAGSRRRVRKVPNPKSGSLSIKAGSFYGRGSVNQSWASAISLGDQMETPESPYIKLEITSDDIHPGPPFKSGGPFTNFDVELPSVEIVMSGNIDTGSSFCNGWIQQYRGGFIPRFGVLDVLTNKYGNIQELLADNEAAPSTDPYEQDAYKKLRPQLERAGAAVMLAEMRDLPRMLKTSAKGFHDIWKSFGGKSGTPFMSPKAASEHFLNHEFGWKPFISDLRKVHKAYTNGELYMRIISRDNNRWIKRRFVHEDTVSDVKVSDGVGWSATPTFGSCLNAYTTADGLGRRGHWEMRLVKRRLIVSEGSFKYYRPEFDSTLAAYDSAYNQVMRHCTMYGLRVNPSTVWQATPWSWLIDWFSNAGDVIQRATDWGIDSMVARYIYQMSLYERRFILNGTANFKSGVRSFSSSRVVTVKKRKEADTGYGFGLTGDLTPRQFAILGALGLSRT